MATLIYYDESAYNTAVREASYIAAQLTDLVAQFVALALPGAAPITTSDLPDLLADPATWALGKFLGNGPLLLGNLPVNAHKALESGLIDKPSGLDAFIAAAKEKAGWLSGSNTVGLARAASSYTVDANGVVSFSAAAMKATQDNCKKITATAAQDDLLADLLSVCTVLNRLMAKNILSGPLVSQYQSNLANALIFPQTGGGTVRPNPAFILSLTR